ncbi:long-chain fatty acid transport protein 2-like [Lineus longissimus]|uniref:long-chain fatty acid transport protein 2-like n=1 Tax=Lineus longissimus TaxID=88925 RepID=UPI002B4C8BE5
MFLLILGSVGASLIAMYFLAPWLPVDLAYIYTNIKVLSLYQKLAKKRVLMIELFEESTKRNPKKPFIHYEGAAYSYEEVDESANKVAHFAEEIGLKTGDIVAIMIQNSPEYLWTLFGLQKLGIQVALLNTNIRSKSLHHCLTVSGARTVVFGKDVLDAVESVSAELKAEGYNVWIQGNHVPPAYQSMDEVLERMSAVPIDPRVRSSISVDDPSVFIYTSGTTGLPKAAIVTHKRCCGGISMMPRGCRLTPDDVTYVPLPLYHGSALLFGVGGSVFTGSSIVIRKKFSASHFWSDCRRYNVTVIIYIGELCRYLVSRTEQANDKDNSVRLALGNGLRPEIWNTFKKRFNIKVVREFYAATEGAGFFVNLGDVPGSVGRLSPIMKALSPIKLLKFDYEKESAYRGLDGRCVEAKPGEVGLFVCQILPGKIDFDGYKGRKELNEKKILHNVLKDGDAFYNSGDLLVTDKMHNVYFRDRVGDTFRWKGENVSTTEVASVLADEQIIFHVNVYGIQIPGCDGRAGMAAMTIKDGHEVSDEFFNSLYTKVVEFLPVYARPLFLRLQTEIQTTSTYKYIKINLQRDGFDPNLIKDPLYMLDNNNQTYTPLNLQLYGQIVSGEIRL